MSIVCATLGDRDLSRLAESISADSSVEWIVVVPTHRRTEIESLLALVSTASPHAVIASDRSGTSAMRNAGVRVARGELLAFPDDDAWYAPGTLDRIVAAARVAAPQEVLVARWRERSESAGNVIQTREQYLRADPQPTSITLFVPRRVFERVGGFRPDLGGGTRAGGGEETEWCLRALENGVRFTPVHDALVHHCLIFEVGRDYASAGRTTVRQRARGYAAAISLGAGARPACGLLRRHFVPGIRRPTAVWGAHLLGSLEGSLLGLALRIRRR